MDRWMNIKLEGCFIWPTGKMEIDFEGHKLILLPTTRDTSASIHINTSGVGILKARTIINRFLSIICWCDDSPITVEDRGTGSVKPVPIPAKEARAVPSSIGFPYNRTVPNNPKVQLALALYKEARSINSTPYAFLGYYKIIGILHKDGSSEQKDFIRNSLSKLNDKMSLNRIDELKKSNKDVVKHLYESCRCAIAHAHANPTIDPDNTDQIWELSGDLPIIKEIAEIVIEQEFNVSRTILSD